MPDSAIVLTALRDELVGAGLGLRKASIAGAGYPIHVEPVEGAPAPGERNPPEDDDTLVISLIISGELGEEGADAYRRRTVVDFRYRSSGTAGKQAAAAVDAAIRAYLTSRGSYGVGWAMGDGDPVVFVLSVGVFGGFGPIARSKAEGYTDGAKYVIESSA
jgi:hypothetical protein